MSDPEHGEVTRLLKQWREGSRGAEARVVELVLPDLRRLARCYMRRERAGHTLTPTALVNEAYLRVAGARALEWQDRRHFVAVAARAMRRYLIDHARARPKADVVAVEAADWTPVPDRSQMETALAVDELLVVLERENPELCAIVELKFFLGLTDQEASAALDVPLRTVQRRWHDARTWLYQHLTTSS